MGYFIQRRCVRSLGWWLTEQGLIPGGQTPRSLRGQGGFLPRPLSWTCRQRLLPVSPHGLYSAPVCILISHKHTSKAGSGPTSFHLNRLFRGPSSKCCRILRPWG